MFQGSSEKNFALQLLRESARTNSCENKKFILDYKLEDLNSILSSTEFYRVNRTFIININTIQDVIVYSNNRLKVTPKVRVEKEIIVSREKVSTFKKWFEGN